MSFQVEKGEILGLLGPNGAGKTTTMRIITGYMPASAGTVAWMGMKCSRIRSMSAAGSALPAGNPPLY